MSNQYDILRSLLSDRPIAFHPMLARVLGGVNEALLFQQLAYWSDKGSDPDWIYKTQKELEEETTLTRTQQEGARRNLRRLGVVRETKRGLPAKLYYRVDWSAVFALLEEHASGKDVGNLQPRMREIADQVRGEPAGQDAGNPPPLMESKSTAETMSRDIEASNLRRVGLVDKYDETRLALLPYAQDLARELNDQAPLASTVTRLVNLYRTSRLDMDTFLIRLQQARAVTKERTASIRGQSSGFGAKPKMAYCLAVLEDLVTEDERSPTGS